MNDPNKIFDAFRQMLEKDPDSIMIPQALVEQMLKNNEYWSRESERKKERE